VEGCKGFDAVIHGSGEHTISGELMTQSRISVPRCIRDRATEHPERPFAIEASGRSVSYAEFDDEAMRWAAGYHELGLRSGDTVVSMVRPSVSAYASWIGMAWLGVVDAPCNTDYQGAMLSYLLNHSRSRVAVIDSQYLPRLAAVAATAPHLETVIVIGDDTGSAEATFRLISSAELLADVKPLLDLDPPEIWDTAMMIYTSGTTGPSKGVLVTWAQADESARGLIPPEDLDETDCFYSPFPMFHGSGRACLCLMARTGGRFVVREQFSATHYWSDITTHQCTTTGLVGAMTAFLWNQPVTDDDARNPLERAVMMPVVPHYQQFEQRFGLKLTTCYAMTEIGPPFSTGWNITDPMSCGVLRDGYEVRIVDDKDFEVPVGESGELIVRHRDPWILCQGYFEMPERTAQAWRNGWFHTGDGFRKDAQGRYFFVDRIKDAIRRRGENISSFEVEGLVSSHGSVAECAAIPVPSEWGEDEVKVCVVRSDESLTEEQLVLDLIPIMPRFMLPRYVEFVDELPKTDATMRVKKHLLRVAPLNDRTWDREAAGVDVPKT
jgi:crotonobetaine/carnitine-CoA ligase